MSTKFKLLRNPTCIPGRQLGMSPSARTPHSNFDHGTWRETTQDANKRHAREGTRGSELGRELFIMPACQGVDDTRHRRTR